ncbi:MAG: DUF2147 domain-containing protein [Pseudomonadota bacterium]
MSTPLSFSDAVQQVYPVILFMDVGRYLIGAGLLALILALLSTAIESRRLQDRRASRADRLREFRHSMVTAGVFSVVGFIVFFVNQFGVFRLYDGPIAGWRLAVELIAVVVIHDAYFYWMHRAIHHRRCFRRVHSLHHQSRTPTPWAAYAFSLPEALLEAAILPIVVLFLPIHEFVVFLFMLHMIARNVIGHAGYELFPRWWLRVPILSSITTTTHHDLHHQFGRYNYGLYFTWWDRWMGTEHPEYRQRFDRAVASRRKSTPKASYSIAALIVLSCCSARVEASTHGEAIGLWATPGLGSIVELRPCADNERKLCGRIVWVWELLDEAAEPPRDTKNRDYDRRSQPLVGLDILDNFERDGDRWRKGTVYNPADGRIYRGAIEQLPDGNLRLKGCALRVFCQTQTWVRADHLVESLNALLETEHQLDGA